jgi:sterol desaturase/sphingolipid hydroxylase (fatty acid hydroxylase superfamily)
MNAETASSHTIERRHVLVMSRAILALSASQINYWTAYAVDLLCPIVLGHISLKQPNAWPVLLACFCVGALVFSFVEYGMHRWYFHARGTLAGTIHAGHHQHPRGPSALPWFSSAAVSAVALWLLSTLLSEAVASSFLCGLLAAYLWYVTLHHLQHSVRIRRVPTRWLKRRWAAHAWHHGRSNVNFGVTTSLWDRVLGTYCETRR